MEKNEFEFKDYTSFVIILALFSISAVLGWIEGYNAIMFTIVFVSSISTISIIMFIIIQLSHLFEKDKQRNMNLAKYLGKDVNGNSPTLNRVKREKFIMSENKNFVFMGDAY